MPSMFCAFRAAGISKGSVLFNVALLQKKLNKDSKTFRHGKFLIL